MGKTASKQLPGPSFCGNDASEISQENMLAKSTGKPLDQERKRHILDAALYCFLEYGYSKTSIDDIAKKANLSRPVIYANFKNKEDLFLGICIDFMETTVQRAEIVLEKPLSKKEKLSQICEIMLLEPWERIVGRPRTAEFYDLCAEHFPKKAEKCAHNRARIIRSILIDKNLAETFQMALKGLNTDLPFTEVLRKRVDILIERFTD
jgi:AcrR family transcriptional regulator